MSKYHTFLSSFSSSNGNGSVLSRTASPQTPSPSAPRHQPTPSSSLFHSHRIDCFVWGTLSTCPPTPELRHVLGFDIRKID